MQTLEVLSLHGTKQKVLTDRVEKGISGRRSAPQEALAQR